MKKETMERRFLKYITQNVIAMLGISVYIIADTFFISVQSGVNGLAVLNLMLPLYGLLFALGSMIGIGYATWYGITSAAGKETKGLFMQGVICCCIVGIPFVVLGIVEPESVLHFLGGDSELMALGKDYIRIVMIAAPAFMCNYVFTSFVRNDDNPFISMIGTLTGSILNIVLDYVFMFPLGMGLAGAALATSASPLITILICSTHFLKKNQHIDCSICIPRIRTVIKCCSLGVSGFVGEISSAVTTLVFNFLILDLEGNTGVAAYGVVANTALVAVAILNGIAQGSQPMISEYYGKGEKRLSEKMFRLGFFVIIACTLMMIGIVYIFTTPLIQAFNHEANTSLQGLAFNGMRLYFLGFLFAGINIMMITYDTATDHAQTAILGSLLRGIAAIVVFAIVLASVLGMKGVWLSFLAAEWFTFVVLASLRRIHRRRNRF